MTPLAVRGIRQLYDWVLLRQSGQFLDQVLLSAYGGMNLDSLADGQPSLEKKLTENLLRDSFADWMPAGLASRLRILDIRFRQQAILPDPDHWMGDNQPRFVPVITICAGFTDYQGRVIPLNHAIELLID